MIWDSLPWKDELRKISIRMEKRLGQKRWPERSLVNLEKDCFLAFYAIRKLLEAKKLSNVVTAQKYSGFSYPFTGTFVTRLNWHRINEHYDFEQATPEKLSLRFVCNQMVHSYIFAPWFDDSGSLSGILFNSDFKRNKKLYQIQMQELIHTLQQVSGDNIDQAISKFNHEKGDYDVTLLSHLHRDQDSSDINDEEIVDLKV